MRWQWLKQAPGAETVIVVFAGWAIGPEVFLHLEGSQDVLFVDDYRNLDAPLPDLSAYGHRALVAWSFGVAGYGHWQARHGDLFDRKVAVNGSPTPVHRDTGIPPVLMQKTIDTLSQASFQMFLTRCFGGRQNFQEIDVAARKTELNAILKRGDAPELNWDRIWLSRNDRIFPLANLQRIWAGQGAKLLDAPHVPFASWSTWQAVMQ